MKSASFGHQLRMTQETISHPSINPGSENAGDENSKAFFQHNETMLAQSKRGDLRDQYKHCMDNLMETESEMFCKTVQFVFINDFSQAFTPVAEVTLTGLNLQQNSFKEDDKTQQQISIHQMRGQYFNLELGEWEPFVENLAFTVNVNQTLTQRVMVVKFDGPVILNVTQACLRNFAYTHEAWNAMPEFSKPALTQSLESTLQKPVTKPFKDSAVSASTLKLQVHQAESHNTSSEYSINSSQDEERTRMQLQVRNSTTTAQDPLARKRPASFQPIIEEESKYARENTVSDLSPLPALSKSRDDLTQHSNQRDHEQEEVVEDNSQLEQITPFQIKNQTTAKIMVFQGGLLDPNRPTVLDSLQRNTGSEAPQGGFIRTSVSSLAAKSSNLLLGKQKVFQIESGKHSNYSVNYAQIVRQNEQKNKAHRGGPMAHEQPHPQMQGQQNLREMGGDLVSEDGGFLLMPDATERMTEAPLHQEPSIRGSEMTEGTTTSNNFITLKNAVLVGVRLNQLDSIKSIDMNEISHQDPYVYNMSSPYDGIPDEGLNEFEQAKVEPDRPTFDNISYTAYSSHQAGIETGKSTKQPKIKASQLLERMKSDKFGLFYNYLFYGVVLDKMQKQLIIRTPYVFHNKSLLTFEVIIKKTSSKDSASQDSPLFSQLMSPSSLPQSQASGLPTSRDPDEKVHFILEPAQKFPLDQVYYFNHSIQIKVVDQNTIEYQEEGEASDREPQSQGSQRVIPPGMLTSQSSSKQLGSFSSIKDPVMGSRSDQVQESTQSLGTANRGRFYGRKFSREVSIESLIRLDLNHGPGEFVSGPEADSLCMAIKRQPGELYGTTDLVFLPTISVKNALPCDIEIKRKKRFRVEDEHVLCISGSQKENTSYVVRKSEQKDFHTFEGCGESGNDISLQIQVDGFLLSDEIRLNQKSVRDCDLEIIDRDDNRLTLGMRVQPFKAGYQVTFFAHACIILETVRLLNSGSVQLYYEAESIKQQIQQIGSRQKRQKLAGQKELRKNRFVMCNKDQPICLSVKEFQKDPLTGAPVHSTRNSREEHKFQSAVTLRQDYFGEASVELQNSARSQAGAALETDSSSHPGQGQSSKNEFFSQGLDIKQAGKLTDFNVRTEVQLQHQMMDKSQRLNAQHRKYDFSMSSSLVMADPEDFIFTKMIMVSPKYVLVNQMKTPLEVAQINTEDAPKGKHIMMKGDRKEWFWSDYTKDSLICIRKIGQVDQTMASYVSDSDYSDSDSDNNDLKGSGRDIESEDGKQKVRMYRRSDSFDQSEGIEIEEEKQNTTMQEDSDDEDQLGRAAVKNKHASQRDKGNQLLMPEPSVSPKKRLDTTGGKSTRQSRSRRLKRKKVNDSQWTEADKVAQWEWSKGFDPAQNEQMSMAIMIREADINPAGNNVLRELKQPKLKVIRVTKKLLNNTVFVIFEDESDFCPMYRFVNECRNVQIHLQQYQMDEPKSSPEIIAHNESMVFGFYEPENERKVQLDLVIDRNDYRRGSIRKYQRDNDEVQIQILDLASTNNIEQRIFYQDVAGVEHLVTLSLTNDGQTKTIRLTPFEDGNQEDKFDGRFTQGQFRLSDLEYQMLQKQEDEFERKKLRKKDPNTAMDVSLDNLMISFVAKVQVKRSDEVLIEENRELALFSWHNISVRQEYNSQNKKQSVHLKVGHFQIDNQSDQNPLFQQIFRTKSSGVGGRLPEDQRTPFLSLEVDYRVHAENQVTLVDWFHCAMGESSLSIDSNYLVNFAWGMSQITPLFENKMARVHPLFMKNSICEVKDQDVEQVNLDDSVVSTQLLDRSIDRRADGPTSRLGPYTESQKKRDLFLQVRDYENDLEDPLLRRERASGHEPDVFALQQARRDEYARSKMTVRQKDLLTNVMGEILVEDKLCYYTVQNAPTQWRLWHQQDVKNSKETLYLREFLVNQISMDLSFVVKTADNTGSKEDNERIGPLAYLKMSGLSLINIDQARFRLPRFGLLNFFIGKEDMQKYMSNFYGQSMMSELRKMVGSVGILASPRTLFYSIGDGFHDFVSMPVDGYAESGILGGSYGVAAGTISLTKQIGVGSLQSFQQFCRDAGQFALLITKDKDYMRIREDRMIIEKPANFVDGFGYGANSLIQSLKAGIGGLVTRPYIEGRKRGMRGLGLGVWQGLAGFVFKPLSGALDLTSKSAEGCKNTLGRFDLASGKERVRKPRTFYGLQKKMKAFDRDDALIVSEVLHQVGEGRFKDNHYLEMKLLRTSNGNALFLILTEEQLFLVEANQKALIWFVKTDLISRAEDMKHDGVIISLTEEYEGQEEFAFSVDQRQCRDIVSWLNAIAIEFQQ